MGGYYWFTLSYSSIAKRWSTIIFEPERCCGGDGDGCSQPVHNYQQLFNG